MMRLRDALASAGCCLFASAGWVRIGIDASALRPSLLLLDCLPGES